MTTIYLIRHARKMKKEVILKDKKLDTVQTVLTVNGEKSAEKLGLLPCLLSVEKIYSSHYARAVGTAKYLASERNLPIYVDERLGEIQNGEGEMDSKTRDYLREHDFSFRLKNGESFNDVQKRMVEVFKEIVMENEGKIVAIFSHHIALFLLLSHFLEVRYIDDILSLCTQNGLVITTKWLSPDIYKVEMDGMKLVLIEHVLM